MNLRKRRKDKREKERRLKWIHNTCWVDLNYWEYLRPIYLSPRRTLPLLQTIRVSISLSHPLFHTHTRLCQERLLQTQLIFQTAKLGFQLFPSVPNTCRNIFLILAIPASFWSWFCLFKVDQCENYLFSKDSNSRPLVTTR